MRKVTFILVALFLFSACENCKQTKLERLGLSSWNSDNPDSLSIYTIINFVNTVTCKDSKNFVPKEDRLAVFDMDGTIACEFPYSMETLCSYYLVYDSLPGCKQNMIDSAKLVHIENAIRQMDFDSEKFVDTSAYLTKNITNSCIPADTTPRYLCNQFYKPMVELINYLKRNGFEVYIVSGSEQQFIWGIISNVNELDIDRSHIIGSLTTYDSICYTPKGGTKFYMSDSILLSNSSKGKSTNIYNRINKTPIFAFGNTVNDFDMFAFTSSNPYYETLCCLLNHDSDSLEASYNAYHTKDTVQTNWRDHKYKGLKWNDSIFKEIMNNNHWNRMDMSKVFKKGEVFFD